MDVPQLDPITILSVKPMEDHSRNKGIWGIWEIWFLIHLETLTCASRMIKLVSLDSIRWWEDQWWFMPRRMTWERRETSNL